MLFLILVLSSHDQLYEYREVVVLSFKDYHRVHTGLIAQKDNEAMLDIAAEELRIAIRQLGRITGKVGVEEILDVVFKDFCIGK